MLFSKVANLKFKPEDSAGGSLRGGGSSRGAERGGPLSSRSR